MRQGIESTLQSDASRQGQHELWIDQGIAGPGLRQMQGILALGVSIPDCGPGGDLAARPGRGRHCDQSPESGRAKLTLPGQPANHFLEIQRLIGHHEYLGGVNRASATHCHQHLAILTFPPELTPGLPKFRHVGVGANVLDHSGQLPSEQNGDARQQAERSGLRENDQSRSAAVQ